MKSVIQFLGFLLALDVKGQFIREPQDIHAFLQSFPPFFCDSNISNATPEWIIDDVYVNRHNINESKYTIDGDGIIVSDVEESDNGSTFQCYVDNVMSSIGHLIVVQGSAQQLVNVSAYQFDLCFELYHDQHFPVEAIDINMVYTNLSASNVLDRDSCLNLADTIIVTPPSTCETLKVELNLKFSTELLVDSWMLKFLVNKKGLCGGNCCQKKTDPTSATTDCKSGKTLALKISIPLVIFIIAVAIVIIVTAVCINKRRQVRQKKGQELSKYGSSSCSITNEKKDLRCFNFPCCS